MDLVEPELPPPRRFAQPEVELIPHAGGNTHVVAGRAGVVRLVTTGHWAGTVASHRVSTVNLRQGGRVADTAGGACGGGRTILDLAKRL